MEFMNSLLPIIIYILLIVLIIVAIIIGIKLICAMTKMDLLIDDITKKVKSLDRLFNLVDFASDKVTIIGETIVGYVTTALAKIFNSKNKVKKESEEADYE